MAISSKGAIGAEILELSNGASSAVSSASTARVRANATTGRAEVSAFGGSYLPVGTVFGEDYQFVNERPRTTTTSATFQTKTTLVTAVATGGYIVRWQAIVDQSSTVALVEVRLQNVTGGYSMGVFQLMQPNATGNRMFMGGMEEFGLVAVSNTFEIQYRALGGGTAGIRDAAIEVWRVS